jgi:hydrogenase nickel incorporation protein HypA/HybF
VILILYWKFFNFRENIYILIHEWSIAQSVVLTVTHAFPDKKIKKIKLGIPMFSFLDVEILKEAFDMLKQGSNLENAELEIVVKEPKFQCQHCGKEFTFSQISDKLNQLKTQYGEEYPLHLMPELLPSFISCPYCGSHDIKVIGQEITNEGIEEVGAVERAG